MIDFDHTTCVSVPLHEDDAAEGTGGGEDSLVPLPNKQVYYVFFANHAAKDQFQKVFQDSRISPEHRGTLALAEWEHPNFQVQNQYRYPKVLSRKNWGELMVSFAAKNEIIVDITPNTGPKLVAALSNGFKYRGYEADNETYHLTRAPMGSLIAALYEYDEMTAFMSTQVKPDKKEKSCSSNSNQSEDSSERSDNNDKIRNKERDDERRKAAAAEREADRRLGGGGASLSEDDEDTLMVSKKNPAKASEKEKKIEKEDDKKKEKARNKEKGKEKDCDSDEKKVKSKEDKKKEEGKKEDEKKKKKRKLDDIDGTDADAKRINKRSKKDEGTQ